MTKTIYAAAKILPENPNHITVIQINRLTLIVYAITGIPIDQNNGINNAATINPNGPVSEVTMKKRSKWGSNPGGVV